MAFFKFRKGDDAPAATTQAESVEVLRRRARHRLIGAAVLVLVGVVGFPLLFDTQPRPIAVDIPIEIPDRNKARPLPAPAPVAPQAKASEPVPARPQAAGPVANASAPATAAPAPGAATADTKPETRTESKPEARAAAAPAAQPARAEVSTKPAAAVKPAADASRAQALLDGKPAQGRSPQAVEGRFVVQVGAFADVTKARETRLKVERAGLKTYTHVADTHGGRRIRVRVGPFATRAEADKAAGRIKDLDLPAAVLTL